MRMARTWRSFEGRLILVAVLSLGAAPLGGCHRGDSNQVRPTAIGQTPISANLVGEWALEPSTDQAPNDPCRPAITDGRLVIEPSATYALELHLRDSCPDEGDDEGPQIAAGSGAFRQEADRIWLDGEGVDVENRGSSTWEYRGGVGHLDHGRLVISLRGSDLILTFRKRA